MYIQDSKGSLSILLDHGDPTDNKKPDFSLYVPLSPALTES